MQVKLGRREELLRQVEGLQTANAALLEDASQQEAVVADLEAQRAQRIEYVTLLVVNRSVRKTLTSKVMSLVQMRNMKWTCNMLLSIACDVHRCV